MPTITQGSLPTPEQDGLGAKTPVNLVPLDNVEPMREVDVNVPMGRAVEWVPAAGEVGIQLGDQWVPAVIPCVGKDDFLADIEVELQTGFPATGFPLLPELKPRFNPDDWTDITETYGPYPYSNDPQLLNYPTVGIPQLLSTTFLDCEQSEEHNPGLLVAAPGLYHFPGGTGSVDTGYECGHPGFRWNVTATWDASGKTLTLSSALGFDIKYSTDDSYPTVAYTTPISVTSTDTIRFCAVDGIGCSGPAFWTIITYDGVTPPTSFVKNYPRVLYDDFADDATTADDERGIAYRWTLNDHDTEAAIYPVRDGYRIPDGMGGWTPYSAVGTRVAGRFLPSTSKGGNLSIIAYRTNADCAGAVGGTSAMAGEKTWEIPSKVTIMTYCKIGKLTAAWDATAKELTISTASAIASSIEYDIGAGWQTYSAPLSITETTTVRFVGRGTDDGSDTVADSDEFSLAITYDGANPPADFSQDFYTALPSEELTRTVQVGAQLPLYPTRFVSPTGTGDGLTPATPCAIDDVVIRGEYVYTGGDTDANLRYDFVNPTIPAAAVWPEFVLTPYTSTFPGPVVKLAWYNANYHHGFFDIWWGSTNDNSTFTRFDPDDDTTWPTMTDNTVYFEARPKLIERTDDGTLDYCTVDIAQTDNGVSSQLDLTLTFPDGSGEDPTQWYVVVNGAYERHFYYNDTRASAPMSDCVGWTQQIYPQPSGSITVNLYKRGATRKQGAAVTATTTKGEFSASMEYYSAATYEFPGTADPITPVYACTRKTGTSTVTAAWDLSEKTLTFTGIPANCTLLVDTTAAPGVPSTPYSEPLILDATTRAYRAMLVCTLSKTDVLTVTSITPTSTADFSQSLSFTWSQDEGIDGSRNKFVRASDVIWLSEGTHVFTTATSTTGGRFCGRWYGGFDESFNVRDRALYASTVQGLDAGPDYANQVFLPYSSSKPGWVCHADGITFEASTSGPLYAIENFSHCKFTTSDPSVAAKYRGGYFSYCTFYGKVSDLLCNYADHVEFADSGETDYLSGTFTARQIIDCAWDFSASSAVMLDINAIVNSSVVAGATTPVAFAESSIDLIYESAVDATFTQADPEATATDWTFSGNLAFAVGTNGDLVVERVAAYPRIPGEATTSLDRWNQAYGVGRIINSDVTMTLTPASDIVQPDMSGFPTDYVMVSGTPSSYVAIGTPIYDLTTDRPTDAFVTLKLLTTYAIRSSVTLDGESDTTLGESYDLRYGTWDWNTATWADLTTETVDTTYQNPISIELDYGEIAFAPGYQTY